ncbi:MAG: hypothetical protein AN483_19440 [Aphanizomenon flos-aquae MDT14a]|jgi:hypothetical protein|nr:MAG: hypothetical protein AN483_19440 [Aphanizomenon flos-aquae MDT14a]
MKLSALVLQNIQHTANVLGMFQNGIITVPSGTVIKLAFVFNRKYKAEDVLPEIYSHIEIYNNYKVVSPPESTVKDDEDELWISISIEISKGVEC